MKKAVLSLFNEIFVFAKKDFHLASYIYLFALIFVSIFLNYKFGFYRDIMRESYFEGKSMYYFPLFYMSLYFVAAIPLLFLRKQYAILTDYKFYLKSIFIITIYGLSIGFYDYRLWTFAGLFEEEIRFVFKIISQYKSIFFYFIPLLIMKKTLDRKVEGIYGLTKNSQHLKGYFSLYLILLPFLILISFTSDFQSAYPQFKPWEYGNILGMKSWLYIPLFELSYAIDFVMTELLFRGALVIGMVSILGRNAVLPMVAMYVAIHFGKPVMETISSIFGGYILGALAYQTRHIWGGVIVHIGIALSMEVLGMFQNKELM
jgi:hypothetical protein